MTAKDSGNLSKTSTIKVIIDQKDNTPLQIGNTPCDTTTVTIGNTTTCSITPVDPDGISDVTATLNGLGLSVAQTILPDGKIRYSATLPSTVNTNDRSLIWRAIGKNPNGADESPQTATQIIKSVYPVDTPLTF